MNNSLLTNTIDVKRPQELPETSKQLISTIDLVSEKLNTNEEVFIPQKKKNIFWPKGFTLEKISDNIPLQESNVARFFGDQKEYVIAYETPRGKVVSIQVRKDKNNKIIYVKILEFNSKKEALKKLKGEAIWWKEIYDLVYDDELNRLPETTSLILEEIKTINFALTKASSVKNYMQDAIINTLLLHEKKDS